jgi:hypothetical protein
MQLETALVHVVLDYMGLLLIIAELLLTLVIAIHAVKLIVMNAWDQQQINVYHARKVTTSYINQLRFPMVHALLRQFPQSLKLSMFSHLLNH